MQSELCDHQQIKLGLHLTNIGEQTPTNANEYEQALTSIIEWMRMDSSSNKHKRSKMARLFAFGTNIKVTQYWKFYLFTERWSPIWKSQLESNWKVEQVLGEKRNDFWKRKVKVKKRLISWKPKAKVLFTSLFFITFLLLFTTALHGQLKNFISSLIACFRNFWEKVKSFKWKAKKIFKVKSERQKQKKLLKS